MSPLGDRRAPPELRRAPGRHVLPVLVLMCGFFLAHGIQCSVHAGGPHPGAATAMSAPSGHEAGLLGAMGMTAMDVLPVAINHSPVGDGGALPVHGLLACLAVLIAIVLVVLVAGRTRRIPRGRDLLEGGAALMSRSLQKWRAAVPDLSVLCVSRT